MKKSLLFVPLLAVLTLAVSVLAQGGNLASNVETTFNGIDLSTDSNPLVSMVGDVVPVRVTFDANDSTNDVRIKVSIEGTREDVSAETSRFDIIEGNTYTKVLTLELPGELKDTDKDYTLYVEIVSSDSRTEKLYTIAMQRDSYVADFLAVDYNTRVSAGETVPVVVTVENTGFNTLDDVFVAATIPDLGIFARGFVGDLVPVDNSDDVVRSFSKTVYFKVPEDAKAGVYEMQVTVYSDDSEKTIRKLISVEETGSDVIAAVRNMDIKAGETVNYDLIVVNSADNVKAFRLSATSGNSLSVSVPSVITVGPKSSETITVAVTAADDASVGTQTFSVNVDGKSVVFGANITKGGNVSSSVLALTVVLVVIFVVLLAVLIILLTRKEKPIEDVETSYY